MKSKYIFQIIKSWWSDNKNESEITQELVIEPDPYRMGMRDRIYEYRYTCCKSCIHIDSARLYQDEMGQYDKETILVLEKRIPYSCGKNFWNRDSSQDIHSYCILTRRILFYSILLPQFFKTHFQSLFSLTVRACTTVSRGFSRVVNLRNISANGAVLTVNLAHFVLVKASWK